MFITLYHIASVFGEVQQVRCMKLRPQTNSIIITIYKRSPGDITPVQIASRHWYSFILPCSWYGWIKYEEEDSWSDYEVVQGLFIAVHSESKRFFWYMTLMWHERNLLNNSSQSVHCVLIADLNWFYLRYEMDRILIWELYCIRQSKTCI